MPTVAYNNAPNVAQQDTFLREARKAKSRYPFTSLRSLSDVPDGQSLLIIADHGTPGVQGVGSGSGRDFRWATNLNADHFSVLQAVQALEPDGHYATTPQCMFYGVGLGGAGENDNQRLYVMRLFSKINPGGVVFLAGCNVGEGAGVSLIRDLALVAQRSIKVIACKKEVAWLIEGSGQDRVLRLAMLEGRTGRAFDPSDLVGFMGARPLVRDELNAIIPSLVAPTEF